MSKNGKYMSMTSGQLEQEWTATANEIGRARVTSLVAQMDQTEAEDRAALISEAYRIVKRRELDAQERKAQEEQRKAKKAKDLADGASTEEAQPQQGSGNDQAVSDSGTQGPSATP